MSGSTSRVLCYAALLVSLGGELYSYFTGAYVFLALFLLIVVLLVASRWPQGRAA